MAPRQAPLAPWSEVHVDSIGPWRVKVNRQELVFSALTIIDPVTNLVEIAHQNNKQSATSAHLFETAWLSRYPRPRRCIHDNGPEFKADFQVMLHKHGITPVPVLPNTPTSNAIIESVHKTIGQVIRTLVLLQPPTNLAEATKLVETGYATAMHATRCAAHASLQNTSPGALVFRRDMFLDIPLLADIFTMHKARQHQIDERLLRENSRRSHHDYQVGEQVYIKRPRKPGDKARPMALGPFPIVRVHTNSTVTVQRSANVTERINIRRLRPPIKRRT